jgi:hypothetical protein
LRPAVDRGGFEPLAPNMAYPPQAALAPASR